MKTMVYTCDICKQSKSEDDLCSITIGTRGIRIHINKYHSEIKYDFCKECLKKKGFIVESPSTEDKENTEKHNQKTFETRLVDILSDLGVQFYE